MTELLRLSLSLLVFLENYRWDGLSADGDSAYRRVYEGKLSPDGRDEIGVQCWNGPSDARDQHWYRFRRFRVVRAGQ